MSKISENIRKIRMLGGILRGQKKRNGDDKPLSSHAVGEMIGRTGNAVGQWEKGNRTPGSQDQAALCYVFDIDRDQLVSGEISALGSQALKRSWPPEQEQARPELRDQEPFAAQNDPKVFAKFLRYFAERNRAVLPAQETRTLLQLADDVEHFVVGTLEQLDSHKSGKPLTAEEEAHFGRMFEQAVETLEKSYEAISAANVRIENQRGASNKDEDEDA